MNSSKDIQNFNALFNEYYRRFIRFAIGYLKDEQVAEDFVSEAFTVYWENKDDLLPETNPPAYILTIIKNKCLNHIKHIRIQQRVTDELKDHNEWVLQTKISTLEACDPDFIFSKELQEIIDNTLEKLPEKTQQIFSLSRDKGLTYKDIAAKTDLSQKAVEFHISKALHQLRVSLKDFIALSVFIFLF
ncbi:MAG: RNA polymerase sigma-70 factor [Fermentimonas sp.]|nr:RNA polymerase sigma-70 factor [Fermentimonas sp.]